MQTEIHDALQNRPDLRNVVRREPHWYRLLTREPSNLMELDKRAKQFYGKTWSQRIERVGQKADMFNMLVGFSDLMRD